MARWRGLSPLAGVVALALAGCSTPPLTGEITVEVQLDFCLRSGSCIGPPATDATVVIYRDGVRWDTVQTDDAGSIDVRVPPGEYSVQAKLPALGLHSHRTGDLQIFAGSGADWTVVLPAMRLGPKLKH